MALSRDGRLLYVATGTGLTVVNTVESKVVKSYLDLPTPYKLRATTRPLSELGERLQLIKGRLQSGVGGQRATTISDLTLSPDGSLTLRGVPHRSRRRSAARRCCRD